MRRKMKKNALWLSLVSFEQNMKEKLRTVSLLTIMFLSLIAFVMTSTVCSAQEWSRKDKGEIFALCQHMSGDTTSGLGIEMEVDDTTVGGFGIGSNFNDHLNLNADMFFGSTDMIGRAYGVTVTADTYLFGMDFNLDVNILKSRFTPMVSGGIGFINFTGDFNGGDFDETDFSYNLGAGFRWDVTDHFLIKGIYRATWTKLEDTDDSILLDGVSLSSGYVF